MPRISTTAIAITLCLLLAAGAVGLWQYLHVPNRYVEYFPYEAQNQQFAAAVLESFSREDSLYGLNMPVRGYTNHLFEGGVVELASEEELCAEAAARGKRYAVYITAQWGTSNTYAFLEAVIYDLETGSKMLIPAGVP